MRTRIKICGITRTEDARFCASIGIDAIGLVFYPPSPRYIEPDRAREIIQGLPPFVTVVGLFMNAEADEVSAVIQSARIDLLQFHGQEPPGYCSQFGRPYIKAVAMGGNDPVELDVVAGMYHEASGLLLDSHNESEPGGSGKTFDWDRIREFTARPVILAGGLNPENVQSAVMRVHPYAVDCSSGVESAPGIKDHDRIRQFMENARHG